ncbi:histidine kinase dimerization/phospho-acceptor domain-containing protein [Streptomyces kanamyceticus]|uniref:histidine kinase dimerization/phospho-acceptor domain-containing protein n=1 Tax=Streptomyces kanamyceticus TaxID=1967 RepID=UPI0037DC4806
MRSQRRFTADAAHELRTPLAIQRTAIEVGLTDPGPRRVARTRADMLTVVRRSEHLIESLLLLSTSDQGLEHYADVPLHDVVRQVLAEVKTDDPRLTAKIVTGVPPESVSRLLEPFQRRQARGHQAGEGVGLGLAIVTSIAHAHAATTHVRAKADGGLTVELGFPAIDRHER